MTWITTNWPLIVSVLWGLCEVLALIPGIKSNSIFTLVYNVLKGAKDKILPPAA